MTTTAGEPPGADVRDNVRGAYEVLRDGFRALPYPDARTRKGWLRRLVELVRDRRDAIVGAIDADFGHRSRHESLSADVYVTVAHTRYLLRHVDRWMEPEARPLPLALLPGQARVLPQPKGVVGVLAPWNYPVQLSLLPLATALAAGNRVLLKPSEHTPRTTELLCEMLAEAFPADVVGVVVGGPSVGVAVSELPLDHLFFTGSEHVGRKVLAAAAKHLVPVTLELGGKAPAFVLPGAPGSTARAIAAGKLFNAGQTCLAPDYALVVGGAPAADTLVDQIRAEVARMLPTLADNPDYTSLIHDDAAARHQALLDDAAAKGATLVPVSPAGEALPARRPAPTLVRHPTDDMRVMQEEIFAPILPVVQVDTVEDGLRYLAERPRPLSLYLFDTDAARIEDVLRRTHTGGVTINDCFLHCVAEALPFGGIGASGMGAYHGKAGFDELSHHKAVFHQARLSSRFLSMPPFGRAFERLLDFLL